MDINNYITIFSIILIIMLLIRYYFGSSFYENLEDTNESTPTCPVGKKGKKCRRKLKKLQQMQTTSSIITSEDNITSNNEPIDIMNKSIYNASPV